MNIYIAIICTVPIILIQIYRFIILKEKRKGHNIDKKTETLEGIYGLYCFYCLIVIPTASNGIFNNFDIALLIPIIYWVFFIRRAYIAKREIKAIEKAYRHIRNHNLSDDPVGIPLSKTR